MPAPHGRDLEDTRRRLTEWLEPRFPQARDLRVANLAGPGSTGFSSETLLFDLAWTEGGDSWSLGLVLRLEPTGFRVFPAYDVARQFRIQKALWKTGVPVPRMYWHEEHPGVLGAPFYVMERTEGRIPSDNPPYHVGGWVTEIRPEERTALWWSGLEVLARIHRLDPSLPKLRFLEPEGDPRSPLLRQLDDYERFLAWAADGTSHPTCEYALEWLRKNRPRAPEPRAVCWGDARIGNMVFQDSRCAAVLDWEMATIASPEQDLAWWLFFDHHHSAGLGAPRLPGFPGREETIERWEEWTGREARHLAYYEVFAAFRFSVIMIRVAKQMKFQGVLPADSAFDRDNIPSRLLAAMLALPPLAGGR